MPIKDLVERYQFGDGLPCFAIIRKGAPKPNDKQPGRDLPGFFRVVMQPGFERFTSTVETLFGAEPKEFGPVRFLGAGMNDVFEFWLEEHVSTKMIHRCDGEQQVQWFNPDTGKYERGGQACARGSAPPCACKPSGVLKLSLPDLNREIGLPGYVKLVTTSWEDVRNLMSCFKDIERMGYTDLRRVEFVIGRAPKAINTPVPEPKTDAEQEAFRKNHNGKNWKPGEKAKYKKSLIYFRVSERFSREFMLPLSLTGMLEDGFGKRQLESTTGTHIVHEGDERPQRRIGGPLSDPLPPPEDSDVTEAEFVEDDDEAGEEIPDFALPKWEQSPSKNADMWAVFVKTARDKYSMTEATVKELLMEVESLTIGDWRIKRNLASACLIANSQRYDCKAIEVYTSKMTPRVPVDTAHEINDLACLIAVKLVGVHEPEAEAS